jgi:hypothetical protein
MNRALSSIGVFFLSALALASEPGIQGTVSCSPEYPLRYGPSVGSVRLSFDQLLGPAQAAEGSVQFAWSATECEDFTTLTVDAQELAAFTKGASKKLRGRYELEEGDQSLKLNVVCIR